jgi:hypothetical protein
MSTRTVELEACLVAMVRSSAMLMRALDAARVIDPPDWLIGSGVIRNLVWDRLHGFDRPTTPKDLDLVFFDPAALGEEREQEVQHALSAKAAEIPWDAQNQAAVHLWYPDVFGVIVEPLTSSADAVATWPETASTGGACAASGSPSAGRWSPSSMNPGSVDGTSRSSRPDTPKLSAETPSPSTLKSQTVVERRSQEEPSLNASFAA